jgi:hypothetical protein
MSLQEWLDNRWLSEHTPSPEETRDLFLAIERDLADCRAEHLSPDWMCSIAFAAAIRAATAALAAAGYRPSRDNHHFRVVQSLALTIEADEYLIDELDLFRRKRNISTYERIGIVSTHDALQMIELAERIRDEVLAWLRENHPDLLGW